MPGLHLSCGLRQTQGIRLYFGQRHALTQEQKCALRQEQVQDYTDRYQEYLNFVSAAYGLDMVPSATCPKCIRSLKVAEIVLGFKTDVNDFTTECPRCKTRFEPTNLLSFNTGREVAFYCKAQTSERLPGKESLEPADFEKQFPEIYFSAIFWFGSLLNAFRTLKIEYRRERVDREAKARSFLGQVSDKDIAVIFGIGVNRVVEMRQSLRIPRCRGKGSIIPANWNMSFSA